jgi:pantetheine-phosphate adenylyltransferase
LHDKFGPTIDDPTIDTIVVSEETAAVANEINSLRAEKGLKSLKIIKVPNVYTPKGELLTSTSIRSKLNKS